MTWEHDLVEATSHIAFVKDANAMGRKGWELVHIDRIDAYGDNRSTWLGFFRRVAADGATE